MCVRTHAELDAHSDTRMRPRACVKKVWDIMHVHPHDAKVHSDLA